MANVQQKSMLTYLGRVKGGKHPRGLYRCECGVEKEMIEHSVRKGYVVSCGCYIQAKRTKHGLYKHPLYTAWANIKDRCYNTKCKRYYTAGARGVTMCDEWKNDFKPFYDWCMANGWKEGMQVDKDLKAVHNRSSILIYSPDTCSIVSCKENNNYKSNSRMIEYNGQMRSITFWSEYFNIRTSVLRWRLERSNWIISNHTLRPVRPKSPPNKKT